MIKLQFPAKDLLAITDPREVPAYDVKLAAHYLRMPAATLRSWVQGRTYKTRDGQKRNVAPVINLPDRRIGLLSFYNLAEAHVLSALRREHEVPMYAIKRALDYVKREKKCARPLIDQTFEVSGAIMLVDKMGELVEAVGTGQRVLGFVREHLHRIEWEDNIAAKLYPFTRRQFANSPRMVLIDPRYSYGQPFLASTKVPTAIVAERYKAGDSVKHLAVDYGCPQDDIEEAIRCELNIGMAA